MAAGTIDRSESAPSVAQTGRVRARATVDEPVAEVTDPASVPASGGQVQAKADRRRGVLYPNHYAWYILAATLDVIVTHQILHYFQGSEVNKLADLLIGRFGLPGMIGLKYSSIIAVVLICEIIGRRSFRSGRRLAVAAIVLSALPVGIGLLQLWVWTAMQPDIIPTELEPFRRPAPGSMGQPVAES